MIIPDASGFPHVFWKCIRPVAAGATLWGDYGPEYNWQAETPCTPMLCAMMRRMLVALRGCSAAFPLHLD